MTTYNPSQAFDGVLFPCHGICIMFNTTYISDNKYKLNVMMTQRSCDYFLGVPFNIASYALLVYMICDKLNHEEDRKYEYIPGELIMNLGDTHIYEEHKVQAIRQLLRTPYEFPTLTFINHPKNIEDYKIEDIVIKDYKCHPGIIAKMIA
jgi:thymidylate synthase